MAIINNPRKGFQFRIIISGIQPFLVQTARTSDVELDVDEHGETNHVVKTAGMVKFGTVSISKICPVDFPDEEIWAWITQVQNALTGGGALPSVYKRVIIIEQLSLNNVTVIKRWTCLGAWPQRINGIEFNRVQSGNTMENIEFCIDRQQT